MEQNKVINFEYLNAIKYHNLEQKLTELGVSDAWVGGKKKSEIINDALSKIAKIEKLKKEGTPEEDIQKELDLIKAEEAEQAEEALLQQQILEEEEREAEKKEIKKHKFTKVEIEKSLHLVNINMRNNVKGQRPVLLKKRKALMDMLEEME